MEICNRVREPWKFLGKEVDVVGRLFLSKSPHGVQQPDGRLVER